VIPSFQGCLLWFHPLNLALSSIFGRYGFPTWRSPPPRFSHRVSLNFSCLAFSQFLLLHSRWRCTTTCLKALSGSSAPNDQPHDVFQLSLEEIRHNFFCHRTRSFCWTPFLLLTTDRDPGFFAGFRFLYTRPLQISLPFSPATLVSHQIFGFTSWLRIPVCNSHRQAMPLLSPWSLIDIELASFMPLGNLVAYIFLADLLPPKMLCFVVQFE